MMDVTKIDAVNSPNSMHQPDIWTDAVASCEALAEPYTRQFAKDVVGLAGGMLPGERVVGVAAGTGALTLEAAAAGACMLGTDFSPGMVARLAMRLAEAGYDKAGG